MMSSSRSAFFPFSGVDIRRAGWYAEPMTLFSFLWIPLVYLFWRAITEGGTFGWAWALIAGSIAALTQFLAGPIVDPGAFGFARWASGFVDIVALPVLVPVLVYALFFCLKLISADADFSGFALLWLIPVAVARALALSWDLTRDPILLVLVPFLWAAIAVGMPFFIGFILNSRPALIVLSCLAALAVPAAAVSSYWAFFSQRNFLGVLFLVAASAPMLASLALSFVRAGDGG